MGEVQAVQMKDDVGRVCFWMSLGFERESASISVAEDKTGENDGGRPAHSHGERRRRSGASG